MIELTWIEQEPLSVIRDGAYYVMSEMSEQPVSPPMLSQEQALGVRDAIYALRSTNVERYRAVIRGQIPAPWCEWLIGGGAEAR
jgi:hypothetical protein